MNENIINNYNEFMIKKRIKVNLYLNRVLWFFIITGPAIALGIKKGFFRDVTYGTCVNISVVVIALSSVHFLLMKKIRDSLITCVFALTALDSLIVYMAYSHVNIYLTWFLVPLLSLLFCDKYLYGYAIVMNYILMFFATWKTSAYFVLLRADYEERKPFFVDIFGGFTIETFIMVASGYIILKLTTEYYKELFKQYEVISEQEKLMKEKMEVLDSMAEIYDNVNMINFVENTEMPLRDPEQKKHGIDMNTQTHTLMNQKIKQQIIPDQLEAFLTFTNIKTVRARLAQKKVISADFIDVVSGWFRAQYIKVDATLDGIPNVVIYTTRNVDEEKRREEHLIRLSLTDEMTRLYNRRCYDEDLGVYRTGPLDERFVLFSIDVNGLKKVNDTKGHAAGDELIKGAADCLSLTIGQRGKVYRTGGDEFMAIVHTDEPEKIREEIRKRAAEWHGMYTDEMTMSVGFATAKELDDATVDQLEHKADEDMYAEKDRYYKEKGIERRR